MDLMSTSFVKNCFFLCKNVFFSANKVAVKVYYKSSDSEEQHASFVTSLSSIGCLILYRRHVKRVAGHEDDDLEALYEQRKRKASLLKRNDDDDKLQVDPVDALPVKTIDGKLEYRTGNSLNPTKPTSTVTFTIANILVLNIS